MNIVSALVPLMSLGVLAACAALLPAIVADVQTWDDCRCGPGAHHPACHLRSTR